MAEPRTAPSPTRPLDRAARVLVVVEDEALAKVVDLTLRHGNNIRRSEHTVAGARAALAEWRPHLLLIDIDLETGAGIQLIDEARAVRAAQRVGPAHDDGRSSPQSCARGRCGVHVAEQRSRGPRLGCSP